MLKLRLITAAVLAAVLLPVLLLADVAAWAVLSFLFVLAAAWEWQRLVAVSSARPQSFLPWLFGLLVCAGLTWLALSQNHATLPRFMLNGYSLVSVFWFVLAGWLTWGLRVHRLPLFMALYLLLSAWWAMIDARMHGISYLLSLIFLVIAADSFAYFVGRAWGRHKLAPQISPGKTWEGAFGGVAGVTLIALIFILWIPYESLFSLSWRKLGGWAILLWLGLAGLSIIGDLFESALKRALQVKDSSQLLPGHGGVLDRIDALLPVLPVAMLATWCLERI